MKKIDLLLTRHGETIENQRYVLQGQLPGTLSPLGKEQAVVLAEQLKQEPLDVIVCSDLARSYDTAKVVAGYHGKQPQPTPLLREMDWGYIPAKRWRMWIGSICLLVSSRWMSCIIGQENL